MVLERLDEPLENRCQGRWSGPAVDGGEQLPVPLNPRIVGGLQSDQQLDAVVGRVGLAERLGVPGNQIGPDQAGLLGRWVDPGGERRLDPDAELVGQLVAQAGAGRLAGGTFGRPGVRPSGGRSS